MVSENKTVAILVGHEFEDIEMEYCLLQLSHQGADVQLVPINAGFNAHEGSDQEPVRGRFGTPAPPIILQEGVHYTVADLEELDAESIDCILFPGGFSPDHLRSVSEVIELTKEIFEAGKLVAAICHGPWILVEADLIEDREVCGVQEIHTDLANAGATVKDTGTVRDGNIVTGRRPDNLPEFCETIADALESEEVTQATDD
ncbi:DJ-1/PfpI family protein [Haladaptatus sp. DYF46]|uniref:DJ-1/PfpI family protein n=1 Tax=Haladaptatus sp. DYF46 TaxID=2886041 RepID=UPI001E429689|nr:DJ-1/PfpI family protein [Haladaptatus sp. DYF46]